MNPNVFASILGLALPFCQLASAVTVRECIDQKGQHTFEDHCPPQSREVAKREIGSRPTPAAPSKPSITLFVAQDCDACDTINTMLQKRGVEFQVKDVTTDLNYQTELRDRAGDLVVPTLTAGDKIVTGYNKKRIDEALVAVGYPEPPAPAPAASR